MKKTKRSVLKKHLHPFLSYAALLGVGAIAVSTTGSLAGANTETAAVPAIVAPAHHAAKPATADDLDKLKTAAAEFAAQLSVIKSQVAELEKYGRVPPPALMSAIDQGDQLVASIVNAQTMAEINDPSPATSLQAIGSSIAANSKF